MHMADALLSPAVGGTMWAATCATIAYCSQKVKKDLEDIDNSKIPLMGVLGAFIFAAQMINFTIPGTGSSGHLGGGMILAILLGPHAGFLTIASVLTIQALFFADGGLLALGCNIFNLGFFPCFVAYPLIYKGLTGANPSPGRIAKAATLAAVIALQLGAFGVVVETTLSGIAELPFRSFLLMMLPIHLAIGVVEGLITSAVVTFVWKAQPELLIKPSTGKPVGSFSLKKVLVGLLVATALTGGAFSWFASSHLDGLEWSIFQVTGQEELETPERGIHSRLSDLQAHIAILPDYSFKEGASSLETTVAPEENAWPAVNAGTTLSGLTGGLLTLIMAALIGWALTRRARSA